MESKLKYRRPLFWDIPEKDIEAALSESPDWVIPRVFEYGTLEDIFEVIHLYGKEKSKQSLLKIKMKPVTQSMAYLFLDIDPEGKYAA